MANVIKLASGDTIVFNHTANINSTCSHSQVTMTTGTPAAVMATTTSGTSTMNIQLSFDLTPKREPTDEELAVTQQRWSELWD